MGSVLTVYWAPIVLWSAIFVQRRGTVAPSSLESSSSDCGAEAHRRGERHRPRVQGGQSRPSRPLLLLLLLVDYRDG